MNLISESEILQRNGRQYIIPERSREYIINLELVSDRETRHAKTREIRCRICRCENTKLKANGESLWVKDINRDRKFTGEYICYKCYYQSKNCTICNKNHYDERLFKCYDLNKYWTGEYVCHSCLKKSKEKKSKEEKQNEE